MKRLLWLGSYLTDGLAAEYAQLGYRNAASVLSQRNLLEGLEAALGQRFDTIGLLSLPGFPVNLSLYLQQRTFCHVQGAQDVQVGYLNVEYLNRLTGRRSLRRAVKKWMKGVDCRQDELTVCVYEMRSACLAAAQLIRRKMPTARICLIVPDLPQFMDLHMSRLKACLKAMDWRSIRKRLSVIDRFVLYTGPMRTYLGLDEARCMVMEGSINVAETEAKPRLTAADANGKIIVMYSGAVHERFGVMRLVQAFADLDDRYELWITGTGSASGQVEECAKRDARIRYFGFLPTREALLDLQRQATMFVNLRDPAEEASAYCFPSKLFEFMRSGKPVLSCRLAGIPEEYFDYLIPMAGFDPPQMADAIRRVGAMSPQALAELGARQYAFIAERKNNLVQAERIAAFLRE